ncbi:glycosyltransferase family 4 protein [Pseudanabaena biceps]|nr:glycosyltransferase family 4 protein [Pseudanabaena biceps]
MTLHDLSKLRILFSHYSLEDDISGITTWLEKLLLRMDKDGIPTTLYLQHFDSNIEKSSLLQSLKKSSIKVEIESISSYTEDDIRNTLACINRHRPNVFLPQFFQFTFYAASIAGQNGLPWVLPIHSDTPFNWAIANFLSPETKGGQIVGVSHYICQLAENQALAKQAQCIPYGVTIGDKKAIFSDSPFRVVFSGRVVEDQKRISLVLEAMSLACKLDPRIECVILGDGSQLDDSKLWVESQDLSDRIQFRGRLPFEEVTEELGKCQSILLMSDYEGLPVALIEAMAIGVVPIVRYILSGVPELVKDEITGILIDDTPARAAEAILHLANNPTLWKNYSVASRELISQNYNEDICYERWLNLIAQLCEQSTVNYPIPIPKKIPLPSTNQPFLADLNRFKPHPIIAFFRTVRFKLGIGKKIKILVKNFL